ncbi:MAG: alpha/beta hydrolase [Spirochaetaceae bacterium]|nr:alpha/beta hydrolase [Spirochaetaceae bacterium]
MRETKRVEIDGTFIAYEERGEGFPIVALHGFSPDRRLMTGSLEPLFDGQDRAFVPPSAGARRPEGGRSARAYRRIYPDLPFMGASGDPETVRDSDGMLEVVAAFVRAILPDGPFILAGESYGGYLARALLREFGQRVEGLFLLCPAVVAEGPERTVPPREVLVAEEGYAADADPESLAMFEEVAVIRDRYCLRRFGEEIRPGLVAARMDRLEALRSRGYSFSFDRLGRPGADGGEPDSGGPFDPFFDRPGLFVLGRQDASVGWSDALRLAPRYPRAAFAVLDAAGHNAQIEQAGLMATLAGEWLGRCEAVSAGGRR